MQQKEVFIENPMDNHCFVTVAGFKQVYEPGLHQAEDCKKHPCADCHFCQCCSDSRCHSCRAEKQPIKRPPNKKLSIQEQIALYDRINRPAHAETDADGTQLKI